MSTPHNTAKPGDIAKTVLMPGDPLRAKFIAENFLENPVQFNTVRNMFGYTGTYKGHPVSVMGSGMGMPSIGIYSYELYKFYGVENIIRVGSAGAYSPEMKLFDTVLATEAWSQSSFTKVMSNTETNVTYPDDELNAKLEASAEKAGVPLFKGRIHSSDVFYCEGATEDYKDFYGKYGCIACEMESFALFHNAKVLGKKAACLLTISDSFCFEGITTPEERQNSFTNMMKVALGVVLE